MEPKKFNFTFINILALLVVLITCTYFFWISFVMTKTEVKDNSSLQQITIVMITVLTLVLNYYFGSSSSSAKQQQTITELQKTAVVATAIATDSKVDKAVKIEQLKSALKDLDPNSEEAKKLLTELEQLEKI